MHFITRLTAIAAILLTSSAHAQLRIVDYNTASGPHVGLDDILEAIGDEITNGFSRPIDVLSLQEQTLSASTTQAIVNQLNVSAR